MSFIGVFLNTFLMAYQALDEEPHSLRKETLRLLNFSL